MVPTCFTKDNYFDRFPLIVSPTDVQKIEEMDTISRMKQLADDGASMVRVLEMAQVLAKGGNVLGAALKKAEDDKKAVEDKVWKLEVASRCPSIS